MAITPRYKQEAMEGHILKLIETRVDYQDIFNLSPASIKRINEVCRTKGLTDLIHTRLDQSSFETNDPLNVVSMPYEYIKEAPSYVFQRDPDISLEVNQFFLKVTQVVQEKYETYSFTKDLISECMEILNSNESSIFKRISIRKANEAMYRSIESVLDDFKGEFLPYEMYGEHVNWAARNSRSQTVQNFEIDQHKVNFKSLVDTGSIDGIQLFRLYMEFEVYSVNPEHLADKENLKTWIDEINATLYSLFEFTLTDTGSKKLSEEKRLGDYRG